MILSDQTKIIRKYQAQPPVRVVALANELGLKVHTATQWGDEISGMIRKDRVHGGSSGYAIFVNAHHVETRRRFTVAHEIAHFILHQDLIGDGIVEDALLRSRSLTNAVERQANAMAADILMPWHLLENESSKGRSLEMLAAIFEVSKDAMSFRILGVSYDDATQGQR